MGDYADEAIDRGMDDYIEYENHKDDTEYLINRGFADYDGSIPNPYKGSISNPDKSSI